MFDLALYRKYRPKNFSEISGQDHIVQVLENSIILNKVAHAYIFVGSRGTGKTSVARIFAREIGSSVNDIYEIDAASNRGIEDIKILRDGVLTLPFDSKYKVYIIDEVHMLSKDAWGALLKTLEEPPRHVIFILATTEPQKVPETIISRCQMFTFHKPSILTLKNRVLNIAEKEGFELDHSSAELIALLGDGSFRDAEGMLQKVLNFFQKELDNKKSKNKKEDEKEKRKIKLTDVEKITGSPKTILVNDFIFSLIKKDLEQSINLLQDAVAQNLDIKLFLKLIIQKFRSVIIMKYAPKLEENSNLLENDLNYLKSLIKEDKYGIVCSSTLAKLLDAYENIDNAFIQELPIELALIDIING